MCDDRPARADPFLTSLLRTFAMSAYFSSRLIKAPLCRIVWFGGLIAYLLAAPVAITRADEFVLLDNGNVIQGKAVVIGPHVVVDRGDGNELKLDSRQVARIAPTVRELYEFRIGKRQLYDVSSHQEDARWCLRHGLYPEMEISLRAADELDPSHPETLRLRRKLQATMVARDAASGADGIDPNVYGEGIKGNFKIVEEPASPAKENSNDTNEDELAALNLPQETVAYYSSRIQPLLINRCGNSGCHRAPSESGFELSHMGTHVRPAARMTRSNLVSLLRWIDRDNPNESPLLRYASEAHGGRREAPLKRSDQATIDAIAVWVRHVSQWLEGDLRVALTELGDMPSGAVRLSPNSGVAVAANVPAMANQGNAVRQVNHVEELPASGDRFESSAVWASAGDQPRPLASKSTRPTRLPTVENPFDPEIFNRNYRNANQTVIGER
jgi:hypothetical protein